MAALLKILQAIWPFVSVLFAPRDGDPKEKCLLSVIAALVTIYIGCAVTLGWWYIGDFANDTKAALILESNKADLDEALQALLSTRKENEELKATLDSKKVELLESKYTCSERILEAVRAVEEKKSSKKDKGGTSTPRRDEIGEAIDTYRQLQLERPQ